MIKHVRQHIIAALEITYANLIGADDEVSALKVLEIIDTLKSQEQSFGGKESASQPSQFKPKSDT